MGKLKEWRQSPLLFVRECIRVVPSDQQAELLHSFYKEKRFTVRSGHGTGKDAEAAWLIIWFLTTNLSLNAVTETALYPKVVCTAPTAHQLGDLLWSEITKWTRQSLVGDEFVIQKDKIFQKDNPKEWWCVARAVSARASKDEQAETIAGFHNENLLIVVDEACHDDKTEVLTEEGFKLFSELSGKERVLTKDPKTGIANYVYPQDYIEKNYDGDMYYYDSDNLNFAVTPNHRLFFSTQKSDKLRLTKIKDIGKTRLKMPKGFKWTGNDLDQYTSYDLMQSGWEPFPIREWLVFIGLFVAEGSFRKDVNKNLIGISISQQNINGRELIFSVLSSLKFNFKVYGNDIVVNSISLAKHLATQCGEGFINKKVPAIVKGLTPELINIFLDAFCVGDGYFKPFNGDFRRIFYTSSPELCNDIQELLFKSGFNATIQYRKLEGKITWIKDHFATSSVDGFAIGESTTDTPFSVRAENFKVKNYKGKIYCLSVPTTELLFTRREGKCFWSGNSGMPDPVFIPLEGALTQENNKVLLIGNMTKDKGYFYDSHFNFEISKAWTKFHWDSRKSSNVKPSYSEYMATKYGVTSNVFRIRVTGDPPLADEKTFIPMAWAMQCIGNDIEVPEDEPLYLSVDVARYGEDDSVIMPGRGNLILPWQTFNGLNIITLAGHVQNCYIEMDAEGVAIDEIGVGAGVVDWLEKKNLPGLFGVNVSLESSDITKFHRLRDELWTRVREKCSTAKYSFPDIIIPGDTESLGQMLSNELSCPTYDFNADGGFVIESKKKMKARGIASPNIADALCLREYFFNYATKVFAKKDKKKKKFVPREYSKYVTGKLYAGKSRIWAGN